MFLVTTLKSWISWCFFQYDLFFLSFFSFCFTFTGKYCCWTLPVMMLGFYFLKFLVWLLLIYFLDSFLSFNVSLFNKTVTLHKQMNSVVFSVSFCSFQCVTGIQKTVFSTYRMWFQSCATLWGCEIKLPNRKDSRPQPQSGMIILYESNS